jgi:hypothetical protein
MTSHISGGSHEENGESKAEEGFEPPEQMKQSRKMECRKNDNKNLANAEEGKKGEQMQMVKNGAGKL